MKRALLFLATLLLCASTLRGQHTTSIAIAEGEYWWGLATDLGCQMPFDGATLLSLDHRTQNLNNQTTPLLLSNTGRYIWCEGPMMCTISGGVLEISSGRGEIVEGVAEERSLRGAYKAACAKFFPSSGTTPPAEFFSQPQYNTWIELTYNQNQADVMAYAEGIVANGYPTGVLMIDDNWQKYYGNFEFRPDRFPDPKGMIDRLHEMGFKVMLWISPFVSPDSAEYRDLAKRGFLLKKADKFGNTSPAIVEWWNGYSAVYDLSNPAAFAHLKGVLEEMQREYGVDGFKFDGGDPERYPEGVVSPYDGCSYDVEQTELWAKLALEFPYNELRACWQMGGEALVQRLGDKDYSWDDVAKLVPSMVAAGLLGHLYTCPDMIGGGQWLSFEGVNAENIDQRLVVRSCQIHSMMPMMQFSVAPWRILSPENNAICQKYAKWHASLGAYILSLARHAAATGEPIVRHMAYEFPGEGFEHCIDQYMLGDRYLVAPIMGPEDSRTVKLPRGEWRDDQGKSYKGGRTYTIDVSIDRLLWFEKM